MLERLGTRIRYRVPITPTAVHIAVLVFSDAGLLIDHIQLSLFAGLLIGPCARDLLFYTPSRFNHRSEQPLRSVGAAKLLAAFEAFGESRILKHTLSHLYAISIRPMIALGSRNLFSSSVAHRISIHESMRADVGVIQYEYKTGNANDIILIHGKVNPADLGTIINNARTQAVILTMAHGRIAIDVSTHESCSNK